MTTCAEMIALSPVRFGTSGVRGLVADCHCIEADGASDTNPKLTQDMAIFDSYGYNEIDLPYSITRSRTWA
jgi:hypothetical protein